MEERVTRLDNKIENDIAKRTKEVSAHLQGLKEKIEQSDFFIVSILYFLQFWLEECLSSYRINEPSRNDRVDLRDLLYQLKMAIEEKRRKVKAICKTLSDNRQFLFDKKTFFFGSVGEEETIRSLFGLPDTYYVFNDVNINFTNPLPWRYKCPIRNCQIDHIVVGPTGFFLLETKYWKLPEKRDHSSKIFFQVSRADWALTHYLKDDIRFNPILPVQSIVVTRHGITQDQMFDRDIRILPPEKLCEYLTTRKTTLSQDTIQKLVRVIPYCKWEDPIVSLETS